MIKFADMAKNVEKFTHDNSPVVLTAIGTVGVITTAVLAGKGAFKAADILRESDAEEPLDKAKETWKCYIPAFTSGILTCGAIIGASQVSNRRAAAMAAAYSLSEKRFNEYRDKVVDTMGLRKDEDIRQDVMTDRIKDTYATNDVIIVDGAGDQLCYDSYSGRYFKSSMEAIKFGMNKVNHQINNDGYASLSDFYDAIGLETTAMSEEVGWKSEELMDIVFTTTMTPDQKPAICIEYRTTPVRNYFRLG